MPTLRSLFLTAAGAATLAACATPTQLILDAEVNRLCAKDGGPHIYETVPISIKETKVPYKSRRRDEPYFSDALVEYLKGRDEGATVIRFSRQIFRAEDGKLLGEAVSYARRGGDIPGPWHPSVYSCPSDASLQRLPSLIFVGRPE
jgi:hypothetical protein